MCEPNSGIESISVVCAGEKYDRSESEGITFYQFPRKYISQSDSGFQRWLKGVADEVGADVVHIHGTEFRTGLSWVEAAGAQNVIVSLQGIISVIARQYLAGIKSTWKYVTFSDLLRRDSLRAQQKKFQKRGEDEVRLLKSVNHVAGRTKWDYSQVKSINPKINYHFVGETLYDGFYHHKWEYTKCESASIFVSQGYYPIKGLHILLRAISIVKREIPEVKVRIAGYDILNTNWLRQSGYGKYIRREIKLLDLENNISFIGVKNEEGMIEEYKRANLFVLPSVIENSPNSLAEARVMGTPVLSSICGGSPEILGWNSEILYRHDEPEVLAQKIIKLLGKKATVSQIYEGHEEYKSIYNPSSNLRDLMSAYEDIKSSQKEI